MYEKLIKLVMAKPPYLNRRKLSAGLGTMGTMCILPRYDTKPFVFLKLYDYRGGDVLCQVVTNKYIYHIYHIMGTSVVAKV